MEVAAVGWGISIAGWIISPYITKLLGKAYDQIKPGKPRENLDNLVTHIIPQLTLTLQAVEGSAHQKELEELVKKLKSACDDTEDILDELQYNSLENKQRSNSEERDEAGPSKQGAGAYRIPRRLKSRLKKKVKVIKKLMDKVRKTLKIKNEAQSGRRSAEHGENATAKKIEKTSANDAPRSVVGRDEVRRQIIEKLHTEDVNPSTRNITCLSVIGIWGIPGSGKTTLAQYIVKSVKDEKYFDLVMWIHVSKSFSMHGIFKEMFEQASKPAEQRPEQCPDYNSRDALIEALKGVLTGKQFLLVLDDIWYNENVHEHQELAKLLSPLMVGKRGSKILVTSRHENGVTELGPDVRTIDNSPIPELDDEVFSELFMHRAFGQKSRDVTLMRIGSEIAHKLQKSPLLATAVGGMLHKSNNVAYWRNVKELLDSSKTREPLWWCYQHLNEQARRCFAYCSIFPRTRHLYRDELVNLWVAEGFISDTNRGWEMETFGQVYFDELVSVGFLKSGGKDRSGKDYFIIHDLLYDIAEKVAGSDCFKIKDGKTKPPSDVRHLSIESCNASMINEDIIKLGNLRTLIIFDCKDDMSEQVFGKMFNELTKLRVLIYQAKIGDESFTFPESISKLRYLRYLGFQIVGILKIRLPAELAKLYLLQVLDLGVCKSLDFSAVENMTNLTNLRHLMNDKEVGFRNIGRLTSLQTIPPFDISRGEGYGLEQLRNLDKLRGKLEILGLESVKSKEEALAAKLADKELLTELVLNWRPARVNPDVQADVLEGLCPPEGLQYMKLIRYEGSRYPSWMVGPRKSTMQLKELELCKCHDILVPAPAPQCFFVAVTSLVFLYSTWDTLPYNMEHVKSLSFEKAWFTTLPNYMPLLTSLKRLKIFSCYSLHSLPALPTSLQYFELSYCTQQFLMSCKTEGHPNWEKIKNIPNIYIHLYPYEDNYIRGEGRGGGY